MLSERMSQSWPIWVSAQNHHEKNKKRSYRLLALETSARALLEFWAATGFFAIRLCALAPPAGFFKIVLRTPNPALRQLGFLVTLRAARFLRKYFLELVPGQESGRCPLRR